MPGVSWQSVLGQDSVHLGGVLASLAEDVNDLADRVLCLVRPLHDADHGLVARLALLEVLFGDEDVVGQRAVLCEEVGIALLHLQGSHEGLVATLEYFSDGSLADVVFPAGQERDLHRVAVHGVEAVALSHQDGFAAFLRLEGVLAVCLARPSGASWPRWRSGEAVCRCSSGGMRWQGSPGRNQSLCVPNRLFAARGCRFSSFPWLKMFSAKLRKKCDMCTIGVQIIIKKDVFCGLLRYGVILRKPSIVVCMFMYMQLQVHEHAIASTCTFKLWSLPSGATGSVVRAKTEHLSDRRTEEFSISRFLISN